MIIDKINSYLTGAGVDISDELFAEVSNRAGWRFADQFGKRKERNGGLYLSSVGKCPRQQAYNVLGFETNGKEIDSRARMVFFQGDMAELAVAYLAKLAGVSIESIGDNQATVNLDGVQGHPDGVLDAEDGTKYLVEIKSMSSYGFEKFEKGDIDDSYLGQVNAYMEALGLDWCVMVALNKDSGVLGEKIIHKDGAIVNRCRKNIKTVRQATKETLPERPYAPDEKGNLPWQCLYCAYWGHCWPNAQKVLVGRSNKLKIKGA